MFRLTAIAVIFFTSLLATANEVEDHLQIVTELTGENMFIRNPSMLGTARYQYSLFQSSGAQDTQVIGSPDGNNPEEITYESKYKFQGFGILYPLGGAAIGYDNVFVDQDLTVNSNTRNQPQREVIQDRRLRGHFLLNLTPKTVAGFTYRYNINRFDVLGARYIDSEDRTRYKGFISGYLFSLFSTGEKVSYGFSHAPPMRGKTTAEGEQKLLTTPGTTGINLVFTAAQKLHLGIEIVRWFYAKDDRSDQSTSPDDQEEISLKGLDINQFYFKTQRIAIGGDLGLNPELKLKLQLYQQNGSFFFETDKVPGDSGASETKTVYQGYKSSLVFNNKRFIFSLSLHRSTHTTAAIVDNRSEGSWFNHRDYGTYRSTEDFTTIGIGIIP